MHVILKFLGCFVRETVIKRVSPCYFVKLTNSKDFCFVFPFLHCHWSIFSNVQYMSASETIFRITGGFRNSLLESQAAYLKAGKSFLKKVTGRIFRISKLLPDIYLMVFCKRAPPSLNRFK